MNRRIASSCGKSAAGILRFQRRLHRVATVLCFALVCVSAAATVTAYTGPIAAGEVPSPYFYVTAGGVPLHVYQAQVRSANFATFTSQFTNTTHNAALGAQPPYTANLGIASFASFQLESDDTVQITFPAGFPKTAISSASQIKILPTGAVDPSSITFTANSITFPIAQRFDSADVSIPQQLTVEVDGDWMNSLHLFINPPDTPPAGGYAVPPGTISASTFSSNPSQIYTFGPGLYWVSGNLNFAKNTELYLEDGAILKWITPPKGQTNTHSMILLGTLNDGNLPPFTANIHGWGIIDNQASQQQALENGDCGYDTHPLELNHLTTSASAKVNVDGIIIRNSCAWNLPLWNVRGTAANPVTINNVKILGYSGVNPKENGSDGIDIVTSQYVNVTHSFLRTADDLIVVKQKETNPPYPTTNITVTDNVLWNELAHALSIGAELYNAPNVDEPSNPLAVDNVTFDSNVIIHDTGKAFLLGVLNWYTGRVQNITFSNITVEENRALIGINLIPIAGSTANPGILGGVAFKNINVTAPQQVLTIGSYVAPVPNVQMLIALPQSHPYVGNGTQTGAYPMAIQESPIFSNVVVNGQTISSTVSGEDYYYLGSGTNSPMPVNVIEKTVRHTNADNSVTYTSSQIPGDMFAPTY